MSIEIAGFINKNINSKNQNEYKCRLKYNF